jgi:hypothetical protein
MEVTNLAVPAHTRRPRRYNPSLIIVHATRGHTHLDLQDESAINWFQNSPDRGGWGSTADALVSSSGQLYTFGDIHNKHSAWSAGYGARGPLFEYGADELGFSVEFPQPNGSVEFTDESLLAGAWLCRQLTDQYDIPIVKISNWSQRRDSAVPEGFLGHEDTANGVRSGKTDPGSLFPWPRFLQMVRDAEVPPLSSAQHAKLYTALHLGRYPGVHVKWGRLYRREDGWYSREVLTKGID